MAVQHLLNWRIQMSQCCWNHNCLPSLTLSLDGWCPQSLRSATGGGLHIGSPWGLTCGKIKSHTIRHRDEVGLTLMFLVYSDDSSTVKYFIAYLTKHNWWNLIDILYLVMILCLWMQSLEWSQSKYVYKKKKKVAAVRPLTPSLKPDTLSSVQYHNLFRKTMGK